MRYGRIARALAAGALLAAGAADARESKDAGPPAAQIGAALAHYAYAVRALPADSVAACFRDDGQLLLPGLPPVTGWDDISGFLGPMKENAAIDSTTMQGEALAGSSTVAAQWGTYRQVAGPKDGAHDLHVGRFAALWSYDAKAGWWRLARLMMQPTPTPRAAVPPAPPSAPTPGK